MPKLLTGVPPREASPNLIWQAGGVKVYYPERLETGPGEDRIRIRLRKFMFLRWLELEGIHAILCTPEEL